MTDDKKGKTRWTTNDLANAAGVDPARIRQLLIEGAELRGEKLGRDWLVTSAEAKRWLESRGIKVEDG